MGNYYLAEKYFGNTMAWGKARSDVESVFKKNNFNSITVSEINANSGKSKIKYFLETYKSILEIKKVLKEIRNQNLFFQYPLMKEKYLRSAIIRSANNNKVIIFVHDLIGIRYGNNEKLEKELDFFKYCSKIIVHNSIMKQELINLGVDAEKLIDLEIFDYLQNDSKYNDNIGMDKKSIAFAGNLDKSLFLSKWLNLKRSYQINLYGLNTGKLELKQAIYGGSFTPEKVTSEIQGSFGLVWDGEDLIGGAGVSGNYIRINNPHKLSMYIASRMPVIVWKESAISHFVIKENIGICIESISDIEDMMKDISESQYKLFVDNINLIRSKIISGYYTNKAIQVVLRQINEG